MIRTNHYFPPQLLARLRQAKDLQGVGVSELIRRAIEEYLTKLGL